MHREGAGTGTVVAATSGAGSAHGASEALTRAR
jgi:hypothetical protein